MRRSIPGQHKRSEFFGNLTEKEIPNNRLRDRLNYGLGHYVEKKAIAEEKERGPELVIPGKAPCEKLGYQRPKVTSGTPGLPAKAAQEKLRQRLEKEQIEKGVELIRDMDIVAKQVCDLHKKFYGVTKFTEEIVLEILNRTARGETISKIAESPHMPTGTTIQKWIRTDPDFQKAFLEAREFQMNKFADEILEIADNSVGDIRLAFDKYGNVIPEVNFEAIQRSKLRIDTRKWLMEKFYKNQYGKDSGGSEGGSSPRTGNVLVQISLPDNGRPIAADVHAMEEFV